VAPASAEKNWNLKLSSPFPENFGLTKVVRHFAELVAARTKSQVKIIIFPAQQLGPIKQELQMCSQGISDIGLLISSHFPSQLPLTVALNFPFGSPYGGRLPEALEEQLEPVLEPEYSSQNVKLMWGITLEYAIWAKSGFVESLEDMKGKKVAFSGGYANKCLQKWGGGVASITGPEQVTALQRGIIDAVILSPNIGLAYKYYRIAPYITDLTMSATFFCMVMNLDTWNSLPGNLQQIIMECRDESVEWMGPIVDGMRTRSLSKALQDAGAKIHTMPQDERQRWIKATESVWQDYIRVTGPKAQRVYEIIQKFR
jgi:TRAP-type C4-dicarboxylate transport system substrate-binding protein